MALYTLKPSVQRIAGSRGGSTFTKTPAGHVIRRRFKPSNPMTVKQQMNRASFFTASKFNYSLSEFDKQVNDERRLLYPRTDSLGNLYYMSGSNLITSQNKIRLDLDTPMIQAARPPLPYPSITSFGSGWSLSPESLVLSCTLGGSTNVWTVRVSLTQSGSYPFLPVYTPDLRIAIEVPASPSVFIDLLQPYIELFGTPRWKTGQTMVIGIQLVSGDRGLVSPYNLFTIGLAP